MPESNTAAVIVHRNGGERTLRCLDALRRSTRRITPVIVVDNGSTDGSVGRIRAEYPEVQLVSVGDNRGYAGGNNLGIAEALRSGAQSVLVLNNDVEIDPGCLESLAAELSDPRVGAAGPIVVLPSGADGLARIWAAGGELTHRENVSRLRGHGEVLNGRYDVAEDVDYLPGCAILLKREVIERVGALDERFFCYMEDVEYGRRIAIAGYRNRFVPAARAIHDASASTGGGYTPARKYMNAVNSVRYLRLHSSVRGWVGFFVFDVLLWPLCLVSATMRGRPRAAFAKLRGLFDGLRGVMITKDHVARYVRQAGEP